MKGAMRYGTFAFVGLAISIMGCGSTGSGWADEENGEIAIREPIPFIEGAAPIPGHESYSTRAEQRLVVPSEVGVMRNDAGAAWIEPFAGLTESGGFVDLSDDGGFTYHPPTGFTGTDHFVYSAVNAAGSTASRVQIKVMEAGDIAIP